jgi:adenylate cyclase
LTDNRVERRLAAILAADVAGYSRLTGLDEEGTHVRLRERLRGLADPKISEHRGKVVKHTGDGVLAEFGSVVDAVRCAIEVQRGMAEQNATMPQVKRIEFRIGIHVGDIIVDDNDIFGDGVNIAARLEGIAEPGGVCISDDAQRQVRGKVDFAFEDMGPQNLKNIVEPMRAWRLRMNASGSAAAPIEPSVERTQALALPDKPSIAVLPFTNLSGDALQDYFTDGVVEDIITELSRFSELFVIARNSSFTYKKQLVDVRDVGRDLGVRYVLEGSVRKVANRVRITGQLIDAASGAHIWADRFESALDDIFALQDQMAERVVGAIAPRLEQAEIERAKWKPTENLNAYDCFLRGMAAWHDWTQSSHNNALKFFYQAIELDPEFGRPYALAAGCYLMRKANGWIIDGAAEITETERLARLAADLGRTDAVTLAWSAHALAHVVGDIKTGTALVDRALLLNANLAVAWQRSGWLRIYAGDYELALKHLKRAMRLNPLDPLMHLAHSATAFAYFLLEDVDEASAWAERALHLRSNWPPALRVLAMSNAVAGREQASRQAMTRLRLIQPQLRVSNLHEQISLHRPEHMARCTEAMRKAGLPE